MRLLDPFASQEAVKAVSLVIAMGLSRACLRVASGRLRAEAAARRQCIVLLVMLAASWALTLLGAAGIAPWHRSDSMPLRAFVPVSLVACLVPLPAWSIATACDLPRLVLQRAVKDAARRAVLVKPVTSHSLRHSFATHLLEPGHDIRTIQELPGHPDVSATMIYTRVLNRGGLGVRSPPDAT